MTWVRRFLGLVGMLGALSCTTGSAQTSSAGTPAATADGRIVKPVAPDPTENPTAFNAHPKVLPDIPERRLEAQVKARIREFETARNAYERRYEELRKKLDGARTADEKNTIRLQIRNALAAWREQSEQLRDDLRQRQRELLREFRHRREALLEDGGPRVRRRPGVDN